jgi:hypothetical protein
VQSSAGLDNARVHHPASALPINVVMSSIYGSGNIECLRLGELHPVYSRNDSSPCQLSNHTRRMMLCKPRKMYMVSVDVRPRGSDAMDPSRLHSLSTILPDRTKALISTVSSSKHASRGLQVSVAYHTNLLYRTRLACLGGLRNGQRSRTLNLD